MEDALPKQKILLKDLSFFIKLAVISGVIQFIVYIVAIIGVIVFLR